MFDVHPGTYVRVRNATQWTMTDLVVSPNTDPIHLDRLAPGELSPYVRRDGAYRYGYVRVLTDGGRERKIIPIDYVGESPLPEGHFTFVLGVSPFMPDSLDIGLEQDQ
jgi:hypothetical protein